MNTIRTILLLTLSLAPVQLFAETSIPFVPESEVRTKSHAITFVLALVALALIIGLVKFFRAKGAKPSKTNCLVLFALGGLGLAPVLAGDASDWSFTARPSAQEIYEQMFQSMKGKLVPLTATNGSLTEDLSRLLLFRPRSTNFSESDLQLVVRPISKYPFKAKYPYVGDKKTFHPMLSLYDATTVQHAAHCLGGEMGWVLTAQAMRESVKVVARIENLLADTKISLVALRPLDFFARDGARIGVIFSKQSEKRSVPEAFIYFLDPEKIGNMPETPSPAKYVYGERDRKYYNDTRVCDHQTAEFVRAVHQEVEAAVAQVSDLPEAR